MKKFLFVAALLLAPLAVDSVYANEDPLLDEARKVALSLPPKLIVTLQQEIAKSGHAGAIDVCKEKTPQIAAEIIKNSGWKIKRVSLKARNATRATPDAWEKAALEAFDQRVAAGESPATMEKGEKVGNEYRYVKALPVQKLCLGCHGQPDQISPEVQAALSKNYPEDHATGYSEGQIRGAISVRKALP